MLLRKYFYWNISFCDLQIEGLPRRVIGIEFPLLCNSLFSKNKKLNSVFKASARIVLHVKKLLLWKIVRFVSCVTISIVRKFWKMPSLSIYLIIQTESSEQLQVYVYQLKSQLKPLLLQRKIGFKNHWYYSLRQKLDSPNFPENSY